MFLPANTFGALRESRGETLASSRGTTITAGASDAKGSWASVGSPTSFAYEGITIHFAANNNAVLFMLDLGFTDGTNDFIIAPNLYFPCKTTAEHNSTLYLPLHIPAGTQFRARAANNGISASNTFDIIIVGHSTNIGGFPGFARVITLFTPSLTRGVAIDPGASANTKGTWTQMTSSCPADVAAIFGVLGYNGDNARAAVARMLLDIGTGASGAETTLFPNLGFMWNVNTDGPCNVSFAPIACAINSGTRVAARAQCSINTAGDRTVDLCLYGLVR